MSIRGNITPLDWATPIVDPKTGFPSPQFIRLWQQVFLNDDATVGDLKTKVDKTTRVIAGTALTGGGELAEDVKLSLTDTPVTPGEYGDASNVPKITVDQQGRITAAEEVPISGGGGGSLKIVSYASVVAGVGSTSAFASKGRLMYPFEDVQVDAAAFMFAAVAGATYVATLAEIDPATNNIIAILDTSAPYTPAVAAAQAYVGFDVSGTLLSGHVYAIILTRTDATATSALGIWNANNLASTSVWQFLPLGIVQGFTLPSTGPTVGQTITIGTSAFSGDIYGSGV